MWKECGPFVFGAFRTRVIVISTVHRGERNGLGRREKWPKKIGRKEKGRKKIGRRENQHEKGEGRMSLKKRDMSL